MDRPDIIHALREIGRVGEFERSESTSLPKLRELGVQTDTARKERHTMRVRAFINQHRAGTISPRTLMDMLKRGLRTYGHIRSPTMMTQTINHKTYDLLSCRSMFLLHVSFSPIFLHRAHVPAPCSRTEQTRNPVSKITSSCTKITLIQT